MTPHIQAIDPLRFQWAEEDLPLEYAETLLEQYTHEDNSKQHILRDFFAPISHSIANPILYRKRS